jgi:hypothetical protein
LLTDEGKQFLKELDQTWEELVYAVNLTTSLSNPNETTQS